MMKLIFPIVLLVNLQLILCRNCAYFPRYPDLSVVSFQYCSYGSSCHDGFTADSSKVCAPYSPLWWISLIMIASVAFITLAIVLICCLVRQRNKFKLEKALSSSKTGQVLINENQSTIKSSYEITEENTTSLNSPGYVPVFSRTATTIDLNDPHAIMPVLPASHFSNNEDPGLSFSRQATIIERDGVALPASHLTSGDDSSILQNALSRPGTTIEVRGHENEFAPVLPASHFNDHQLFNQPKRPGGLLPPIKTNINF